MLEQYPLVCGKLAERRLHLNNSYYPRSLPVLRGEERPSYSRLESAHINLEIFTYTAYEGKFSKAVISKANKLPLLEIST